MSKCTRFAVLVAFSVLVIHPASVATTSEPTAIRLIEGSLSKANGAQTTRITAVEIIGTITADAPKRFAQVLTDALTKANMRHFGGAPMLPVYLDSPGGNVLAAIEMGKMIRALGASTWIRPRSSCASACVLIFAGGVERLMFDDANLGIHRPYFPPDQFAKLERAEAQRRYASLEEGVAAYLRIMGSSDDLFNQMMKIPSNKIRWLREVEAKEFRLVGEDPAFAEWDRARMKNRLTPEFIDWKDRFDDCLRQQGSEECIREHPLPSRPAR